MPYGATFLIFSDYMRPPIRLAALMDIPSIFIFTHDSIGLGEDGPTHQPIEQLMSLRAIPRLLVFRPADANEVAETWRVDHADQASAGADGAAPGRDCRPSIARSMRRPRAWRKGAYIMADAEGDAGCDPDGHGLGGAAVRRSLREADGRRREGRVVSMPCWELFEKQSAEYKPRCFRRRCGRASPLKPVRVRVEGICRSEGIVVGHADFGASAPIKDLMKHFGFTVDDVIAKARRR